MSDIQLLEHKLSELTRWQTATTKALRELEKTALLVEQNREYLKDMNMLSNDVTEIKEKNKWIFRLVIASILTGVTIPFIIKYIM